MPKKTLNVRARSVSDLYMKHLLFALAAAALLTGCSTTCKTPAQAYCCHQKCCATKCCGAACKCGKCGKCTKASKCTPAQAAACATKCKTPAS